METYLEQSNHVSTWYLFFKLSQVTKDMPIFNSVTTRLQNFLSGGFILIFMANVKHNMTP